MGGIESFFLAILRADSGRALKFSGMEMRVPLWDSSSRRALPATVPPALAAC